MGTRIGLSMRRLGVHQGLAPVLDVARDLRWGRVEETIGEDPYLVGLIGSAYVRGLEAAGVVSTLKHFVGYSTSRAGRNLAPVSIGPRELADILLPPFEMALQAGARSVMNAYVELDGLPVAADASILTNLLRDNYGFSGTVVSDYFSVSFLHSLHAVADGPGEAAAKALAAGIDVELPTVDCFADPLHAAIERGQVALELVDRAVRRVLAQKCELGLLDEGWRPEPPPLTTTSSNSMTGRAERWPASSPGVRSCCCLIGAFCRCRLGSGLLSWDLWPQRPVPCSVATRSRCMWDRTTRKWRWAWTYRLFWRRCGTIRPVTKYGSNQVVPSSAETTRASKPPPRWPGRPTYA